MRGRPAEQEKATTKAKRSPKQAQPTTRRATTKHKEAPEVHETVEEDVELEETLQADMTPPQAAPPLLVPTPTFVSRNIVAPDGSVRPGWEMWIGDHCFGRADSKELLLASFQRLQSPPESFHWREVRNRMQMRGRPRPVVQSEPEKDETWEKEEAEEPLLLGEEETEGFQELTWDNA
ncbi:MAG: hypothetical protein AB7P69_15015 [Candidatus Binatia bacterium]